MNEDREFLDEILRWPDNLAARLIYADWLEERGEPRGEFIRVQCELERIGEDSLRGQQLARRAQELLVEHETAWVEPLLPVVKRWRFRRGFVEVVKMSMRNFVRHGDVLFQSFPVRTVFFTGNRQEFAPVIESPNLARLTQINLNGCEIESSEVEGLVRRASLDRLIGLDLRQNSVDEDGVRTLAGSNKFSKLENLNLTENHIGDRGAEWIAGSASLARIARLSLRLCDLTERAAFAFASSPMLASLRRLDLRDNPLLSEAAIEVIRRSPRFSNKTRLLGDRTVDEHTLTYEIGDGDFL